MDIYRSNDYKLTTEHDTLDDSRLKHQQFSTVISTFGTLAHYLPLNNIMDLLNQFGYRLLSYVTTDHVDPLLLASICEFAHSLVTNKAGVTNAACIENIFNAMGKLTPLLIYMGDSYTPNISAAKYRALCVDAEMYYKGTMLKNEPVPLEAMGNPVIHRLFIAILKLITFVSKHANNPGPIQEKCSVYADILNENGRETILFNCLRIPNDELKLAIARCLDEVSITQIEIDELAYFSRLLASYKNLGAGKTEEVFIFVIFFL